MMNFLIGKRTAIIAATTAAMITAATAAAYQTYKRNRAHQMQLKQLKLEQEAAFENRYFKEYDELADDPDAPVPPRNRHVRETTPQGDVIMTYDADRQVFCYYCDKRSVQFKYLEPVARKYVVEHGCKRLYIDFREELTKAKHPAVKPPSSVFAQLKKYSTSASTSINNAKPINKFRMMANATANATTCGLKEHVTRYLHCGRLSDFNADADAVAADTYADEHDFNVIKPIDYASYKKLHAS
jgi:hypothetical protein